MDDRDCGALLSAGMRDWADFSIIAVLLLVNAGIGFWEEHKADNAIALLKQKLALTAQVLRGGSWRTLPADELVPGDIVRVRLGDIVPADPPDPDVPQAGGGGAHDDLPDTQHRAALLAPPLARTRALLDGGVDAGRRPLRDRLRLLHAAHRLKAGGPCGGYALAWFLFNEAVKQGTYRLLAHRTRTVRGHIERIHEPLHPGAGPAP